MADQEQQAQPQADGPPSLIITNDPLPRELKQNLYSRPTRIEDISPRDVLQPLFEGFTESLVSRKIENLYDELNEVQQQVTAIAADLNEMQSVNEEKAAEYYAAVATINTQLQSGTTPGNPRLLKRVARAEANLEDLTQSIALLNQMGVDLSGTASQASFLLESVRAAYSLSGAVEEDHVRLAELEDSVNSTLVVVERLLDKINDDITRLTTYMSSERSNLRTLALAVTKGDLFGKSLANKPFSGLASYSPSENAGGLTGRAQSAQPGAARTGTGRPPESVPLVKIRFDRPDVEYEQPLYMAVNEALELYPNAQFELVAIHPGEGNAAEVAIESTKARRSAERVLRTLTQMGLPLERIELSYSESGQAETSEVHLYIQ